MYYTVIDPNQKWQWKTTGTIVADDLAPRTRAVVNWVEYSNLTFFQTYDRDFSLTSTRTVGQKAFITRSEGPFAFNLRLERETALYGPTEVVLERKPVLEARLRPTGVFGNTVFVEAQTSGGFLRSIRPPGQPSGDYARFDLFPGPGPSFAVSVAVAQRRGGLPLHPVRGVGRDRRTHLSRASRHAGHGGGPPRAVRPSPSRASST